MKRLADRVLGGWVVVGIACTLLAAAGCAKKAENAAPGGAPTMQGAVGGGHPINITWDASANCSNFTPRADTLTVGDGVNFNSSADQADTVYAPAGCFSAADTSFVVTRGLSPTVNAYRAGSYQLHFSLKVCPSVTGGTGPNIIIGDGGH
jgi:plastocyanin